MNLLELRKKYNITQQEASAVLGVPERTYRRYEQDENYGDALKREAMANTLINRFDVTEDKGILSLKQIRENVTSVFENGYKGNVDFCYLFGSYAKGTAKEESDVDLYVVSSLSGFSFAGLIESLRNSLHKRVDCIRPSELNDNVELTNEIMKWGIKIYQLNDVFEKETKTYSGQRS